MKQWIALAALALAQASSAATLGHNVHGYTMDGDTVREFVAMEFDDGKVTALYESEEASEVSTAETSIDVEGATLLPGLIDANGHVSSLGRALASVNLVGATSEAEAVERVVAFAKANPDAPWIVGRGWNQVLWEGKQFPARQSLDAVGDRPVALQRIDGHSMWVNSMALEMAGIDRETVDPEGGQIVRDVAGRATGVLVDNAMYPVFAAIPTDTDELIAQFQLTALNNLAANGITSVHDAGITAQELRGFDSLLAAGNMPVRVYAMLDVLDPENDKNLATGPREDEASLLSVRSVKISADGALGSRGAALFEDYSDDPGNKGLLLLTPEQLTHHMNRAAAAGFQVNTHAIGDLANDRVLSEYERLNKDAETRALRHRVEHAQILRPADIDRFEAAGIVASIQPVHAPSDKNMAGDRLGDVRLKGAYAWHALLASGAQLAGGSDFPVEEVNPFLGLHAAVTRQSRDNHPEGGWLPGEKLDRAETLHLFTQGSAYSAHQEELIGTLLPGFSADFILLRDNYFTVDEQDIWKNKVLSTYVAGRRVYQAP